MAKPRLSLPAPEALRALADGEGRLAVRVTPGAKSEGIEIADGRVSVKVRTKPEDGKATAAVLEMVATALGVAPSRVALLRGATSRDKLLKLPD
ncbi:DUF167 domain-containing protein [Novosphingobium cyanobacteriorum]|uniref:DUF167 domain-containing protein n=1 Tax=Novosphingobium cyanobacteriorum TaxID=3024215 RepID=A0ABT6CHE4_9SPHN|nr:DUF167 domain-containing protein [Novosphingobium cyanobacteriorum]MDF8332944.1 DUF167 domain-containing protein [Novosphingobium cyanobacteriorum]